MASPPAMMATSRPNTSSVAHGVDLTEAAPDTMLRRWVFKEFGARAQTVHAAGLPIAAVSVVDQPGEEGAEDAKVPQ